MSETYTIYQYDICGYFTGVTQEIPWNCGYPGQPERWTMTPVPEIPDGQYAVFDNVDWRITEQPPMPPLPEPVPELAPATMEQVSGPPVVL